jgi:hypothetical protein
LAGELPDAIFAADLWNVIRADIADDTYQEYRDPIRFFGNSYPTESMKLLLRDVGARLSGAQGVDPIYHLATGFGGGKTHNIIAAYHIANKGSDLSGLLTDYAVRQLPEPGATKIAAFIGDRGDPVSGIRHTINGNELITYTPWGEIAYQLGGIEGYRLIKENDISGIAPGRQAWEEICADQPVLIVLDELVLYFTRALALPVDHTRHNVASQMSIFLASLFTFAADRPKTAVIFTLPTEQDANRHVTATLKQYIPKIMDTVGEIEQTANRQARNLTPTQSDERAAILARRLFQSVNTSYVGSIAEAYWTYYQEQARRGVAIDTRGLEASYKEQLTISYPFHPELITLFSVRLASIQEFQATRGALRLMGRTIRTVWDNREILHNTLLLHTHHVDLRSQELRDELLARLGRQNFTMALEADVVRTGGGSHALLVEQGWPNRAATEAATTVFLHSLPSGSRGLSAGEVALSVGRPGYDLSYVQTGLEETERIAWYMEVDQTGRYLFKDRATLNKRFQERAAGVSVPGIKMELDNWIRSVYSEFHHFQVIPFPEHPFDISDNGERLRLAIIHYDKECGFPDHGERLSFTLELFNKTGAGNSPRVYRNNIVFLLAQEDKVQELKNTVRAVFAWERVKEDLENEQERLAEAASQDYRTWKEYAHRGVAGVPVEFLALERDLEQVQLKRGIAELDVRMKLLEAYRILACPPVPDEGGPVFLSHPVLECYRVDFGESTQGAAIRSRRQVQSHDPVEELPILECLSQQARKLVPEVTDNHPVVLSPLLLKREPLWHTNERCVATQEIWERLRKDPGQPMLIRSQDLLPTLRAGVQNLPESLWYYYDQGEKKTYTRETVSSLFPALSRQHFLYDPVAAAADRVLPLQVITPDDFWSHIWPLQEKDGAPVPYFSTDRIPELTRQSPYFLATPSAQALWEAVREGVRQNRWVLYKPGTRTVIGARELEEWSSMQLFNNFSELWEYNAALESGIYPRQQSAGGDEKQTISPVLLKARCWPSGTEQLNLAELERMARSFWPGLGHQEMLRYLQEGHRAGLWGFWVPSDTQVYYAVGDSIEGLLLNENVNLVNPQSSLSYSLEDFRPGRTPEPYRATGTPREVMTQIWEQWNGRAELNLVSIEIAVNSRDALDGTLTATWPDRPSGARIECQLHASCKRFTSIEEQLNLDYNGRFEELRNMLTPVWPFSQQGEIDFNVRLKLTFSSPIPFTDPVVITYRDALTTANQGIITAMAVPVRRLYAGRRRTDA